MRRFIIRLLPIILFFLATAWLSGFFSAFPINLLLIALMTTRLFLGISATLFCAICLGLFFETITPFPMFAYTTAGIVAILFANVCLNKYITRRAALGAAIVGASASAVFEVALYGFSNLYAAWSPGWLSLLNADYFNFVFWRIGASFLAMFFIFLLARRLSPHFRGVAIGGKL